MTHHCLVTTTNLLPNNRFHMSLYEWCIY